MATRPEQIKQSWRKQKTVICVINYSTGHIQPPQTSHGSFRLISLGEWARTSCILKISIHLQGKYVISPIFRNSPVLVFYPTKSTVKVKFIEFPILISTIFFHLLSYNKSASFVGLVGTSAMCESSKISQSQSSSVKMWQPLTSSLAAWITWAMVLLGQQGKAGGNQSPPWKHTALLIQELQDRAC